MNKYQEALNELYKQRSERYKVYQKHKDWSKEIIEFDKVGDSLRTLQELVDEKYNNPTEEEVLKEFEELGYEISEEIRYCRPFMIIEKGYSIMISIDKKEKEYYTSLGYISLQLHKLLTKLFKAWGWFNE